MLRTDGNFHERLDRKLTKYLTHLTQGTYSLPEVREEFRRIIMAAMRDNSAVFLMVGEGDPMLGDDLRSLDGLDPDFELHPTH